MKYIRRIFWTIAIVLALLVVLALVFIRPVDYTPYFQKPYYEQTLKNLQNVDASLPVVQPAPLEVGFGRAPFTPPVGTPLAGYGDRHGKPSIGVHDSLFVRAFAVKAGNREYVLVSGDILIIPRQLADSVMARIRPTIGLARSQILFSATHSHSATGAWGDSWLEEKFAGPFDPNVLHFLTVQVVEAITKAHRDLTPAEVGWGSFHAPALIRNRLVGKKGWTNDLATFTVFKQTDGDEGVLVSFGAHATVLPAKNFLISGDYPGYLERKLERRLGGVCAFFAGGVGSHRPAGTGSGFDRARMIGETLADSVLVRLQTTPLHKNVAVLAIGLPVVLPKYCIRVTDNLRLAPILANKILKERFTTFNLMVLGKELFLGIPAELSGEIGLVLQALANQKGYLLTQTSFNGSYLGYIVPGKYYHLNSYESRLMSFYGPYMGDYFEELSRRLMVVAWKHIYSNS
ncbi:MAG: hypothetical protein GXO76_00355 [Calditrichaeota bacterium]|nr:hypothetical protein [Calditrichota bacterium]